MSDAPRIPPGPANWTSPRRPDLGGTRAPGPDSYKNLVLQRHGEHLAREATRLFYLHWPALAERYGEKGREHTLEDLYWNLSYLDSALFHGNPRLFLDFVTWLRGFLEARGMGPEITCANYLFLRALVQALPSVADEEADRAAVLGLLEQTIQLFPPEAQQLPKV